MWPNIELTAREEVLTSGEGFAAAGRWFQERLGRALVCCLAICVVTLLGGCASGDSVPSARWVSAFSGTTTVQLADDGSVTIDFGADGAPTCINPAGAGPEVGTWHNIGDGWYGAEFHDFTVEFAFGVSFGSTNFDKMFLSSCGNRDDKVTLAKQ
jgi:hypothetical protein